MNDNYILKKNISFVGITLLLTILYFFMRDSTWHGGIHLHTLMETIATMLALVIGISGLTRFMPNRMKNFFCL
jgi:hypothetical protein